MPPNDLNAQTSPPVSLPSNEGRSWIRLGSVVAVAVFDLVTLWFLALLYGGSLPTWPTAYLAGFTSAAFLMIALLAGGRGSPTAAK